MDREIRRISKGIRLKIAQKYINYPPGIWRRVVNPSSTEIENHVEVLAS